MDEKDLLVLDKRFGIMKEFDLIIPHNYTHITRLTDFKGRFEKEFYLYNNDITDENFKNPSSILQPDKKLKIKLVRLCAMHQPVTSEDCIRVLKNQRALLTGAQGISLLYEISKDQLPKGKWYVSFDEKERLWGDGFHKVPYLYPYLDNAWKFDLGSFERDWYDDLVLVAFCDETDSIDSFSSSTDPKKN